MPPSTRRTAPVVDAAAGEAREAIAAAEEETGLPADDPVRFGAERLLDAVLSHPRQRT